MGVGLNGEQVPVYAKENEEEKPKDETHLPLVVKNVDALVPSAIGKQQIDFSKVQEGEAPEGKPEGEEQEEEVKLKPEQRLFCEPLLEVADEEEEVALFYSSNWHKREKIAT